MTHEMYNTVITALSLALGVGIVIECVYLAVVPNPIRLLRRKR